MRRQADTSARQPTNTLFRAHRKEAAEARSRVVVESGSVFHKSKKLHRIEGLKAEGAGIDYNKDNWKQPLQQEYQKKWGSRKLQLRSSTLDFIASTEGSDWHIDWSLMARALETIRRPSRRDSDGISVLILRIFVHGHAEAAEGLFTALFNDRYFMESFRIQGKIFGKESRTPEADKTRALLPLPAVLTVADAIIAIKLHDLINRICIPPAGVMFGAKKGTQVLDVAHAAQLHLQKGGDNFGEAGLAQGDIATYYDSINCLQISRWIAAHECENGAF